MKKFLLNTTIFLLPIITLILTYIAIDPFSVIHRDISLAFSNKNYLIPINRDYQSTELLLNSYSKNNYNSFILGNSRSIFYQTKTWTKYIEGIPFHLNASNETIFGIYGKLRLLDELNVDIKNIVIVLDESTFKGTSNSSGHLFIKHPRVSKESYLAFHYEMLKGFLSTSFFAYIDLLITKNRKEYMIPYGINANNWMFNKEFNQLSYSNFDLTLQKDPQKYFNDKKTLFFNRPSKQFYSNPAIFKTQREFLIKIKYILDAHNTNYKIIISPLYSQIKLNKNDTQYLREIFGQQNVFDFSGINSFTNDYHNYYEPSHYRPIVCDSIFSIIYK